MVSAVVTLAIYVYLWPIQGILKTLSTCFFFFGDLVSHQGPVSERSEPKTAGNKQIQTFTLRCLGFSTVDDAFSAFLISPSMVLRV